MSSRSTQNTNPSALRKRQRQASTSHSKQSFVQSKLIFNPGRLEFDHTTRYAWSFVLVIVERQRRFEAKTPGLEQSKLSTSIQLKIANHVSRNIPFALQVKDRMWKSEYNIPRFILAITLFSFAISPSFYSFRAFHRNTSSLEIKHLFEYPFPFQSICAIHCYKKVSQMLVN